LEVLGEIKRYKEMQEEIDRYVYDADYLVPPCLYIPRLVKYELDISVEDNGGELALGMYKKTCKHGLVTAKQLVASIEDRSVML